MGLRLAQGISITSNSGAGPILSEGSLSPYEAVRMIHAHFQHDSLKAGQARPECL